MPKPRYWVGLMCGDWISIKTTAVCPGLSGLVAGFKMRVLDSGAVSKLSESDTVQTRDNKALQRSDKK